MIAVAKMIVAWSVALLAMYTFGSLPSGRGASPRIWDGILGLGLVVGLPMLLFACAVALPLAVFASRIASPLTAAIV